MFSRTGEHCFQEIRLFTMQNVWSIALEALCVHSQAPATEDTLKRIKKSCLCGLVRPFSG